MPYRLENLAEQKVFLLTFLGSVTIADRWEALQELLQAQQYTGYKKLVADFRKARLLPEAAIETDAHARRLASEPALRWLRIALVGEQAAIRSVEYMAILRGFLFQRFSSQDEALLWLARYDAPGT